MRPNMLTIIYKLRMVADEEEELLVVPPVVKPFCGCTIC